MQYPIDKVTLTDFDYQSNISSEDIVNPAFFSGMIAPIQHPVSIPAIPLTHTHTNFFNDFSGNNSGSDLPLPSISQKELSYPLSFFPFPPSLQMSNKGIEEKFEHLILALKATQESTKYFKRVFQVLRGDDDKLNLVLYFQQINNYINGKIAYVSKAMNAAKGGKNKFRVLILLSLAHEKSGNIEVVINQLQTSKKLIAYKNCLYNRAALNMIVNEGIIYHLKDGDRKTIASILENYDIQIPMVQSFSENQSDELSNASQLVCPDSLEYDNFLKLSRKYLGNRMGALKMVLKSLPNCDGDSRKIIAYMLRVNVYIRTKFDCYSQVLDAIADNKNAPKTRQFNTFGLLMLLCADHQEHSLNEIVNKHLKKTTCSPYAKLSYNQTSLEMIEKNSEKIMGKLAKDHHKTMKIILGMHRSKRTIQLPHNPIQPNGRIHMASDAKAQKKITQDLTIEIMEQGSSITKEETRADKKRVHHVAFLTPLTPDASSGVVKHDIALKKQCIKNQIKTNFFQPNISKTTQIQAHSTCDSSPDGASEKPKFNNNPQTAVAPPLAQPNAKTGLTQIGLFHKTLSSLYETEDFPDPVDELLLDDPFKVPLD